MNNLTIKKVREWLKASPNTQPCGSCIEKKDIIDFLLARVKEQETKLTKWEQAERLYELVPDGFHYMVVCFRRKKYALQEKQYFHKIIEYARVPDQEQGAMSLDECQKKQDGFNETFNGKVDIYKRTGAGIKEIKTLEI